MLLTIVLIPLVGTAFVAALPVSHSQGLHNVTAVIPDRANVASRLDLNQSTYTTAARLIARALSDVTHNDTALMLGRSAQGNRTKILADRSFFPFKAADEKTIVDLLRFVTFPFFGFGDLLFPAGRYPGHQATDASPNKAHREAVANGTGRTIFARSEYRNVTALTEALPKVDLLDVRKDLLEDLFNIFANLFGYESLVPKKKTGSSSQKIHPRAVRNGTHVGLNSTDHASARMVEAKEPPHTDTVDTFRHSRAGVNSTAVRHRHSLPALLNRTHNEPARHAAKAPTVTVPAAPFSTGRNGVIYSSGANSVPQAARHVETTAQPSAGHKLSLGAKLMRHGPHRVDYDSLIRDNENREHDASSQREGRLHGSHPQQNTNTAPAHPEYMNDEQRAPDTPRPLEHRRYRTRPHRRPFASEHHENNSNNNNGLPQEDAPRSQDVAVDPRERRTHRSRPLQRSNPKHRGFIAKDRDAPRSGPRTEHQKWLWGGKGLEKNA